MRVVADNGRVYFRFVFGLWCILAVVVVHSRESAQSRAFAVNFKKHQYPAYERVNITLTGTGT